MPSRLKPTNPIATDAILVGDPGRALMLAQELLVNPLMSNHARGLWGYTAATVAGRPMSIQATGMGGPSAAIVLNDLVKLGVKRSIRVGTCESLRPDLTPGTLVLAESAIAGDGTSSTLLAQSAAEGLPPARLVHGNADLSRGLLGVGPAVKVMSVDLGSAVSEAAGVVEPPTPTGTERSEAPDAAVTDLQTAALFALGDILGVAVAAVLVVEATRMPTPTGPSRLGPDQLEEPLKLAGEAAARALSGPVLEG